MRLYDVDDFDDGGPTRSVVPRPDDGRFVEVEIQHGLGRLGVDRTGNLTGIEFDERVLQTMDPTVVGACLVDALNAATALILKRIIAERPMRRR